MTENEKLRALLAEARRVLSMNCDSGLCCAVRANIDAALAEPHWSSQVLDAALEHEAKQIRKSHSEFLTQLQRERDEARAEVERLKADLDMVDSDLQLAVKRLTAECERLRKERDAACMAAGEYSQDEVNAMTTAMIAVRKAAERAAFQSGAEAMREAAAHYFDTTPCVTVTVQAAIRALPLPEDK
jgi:hypothetical protein